MATKADTDADRAIALTLRSQSANSPEDAFIRSEVKIFGGKLLTITCRSGERRFDSFVFCDGHDDHHFFNAGELARFLDGIKPQNTLQSILLTDSDRAPAVIAIVITMTICYLAISSRTPPDILGHALTTILGFYFGSKVSDSLRKSASSKS